MFGPGQEVGMAHWKRLTGTDGDQIDVKDTVAYLQEFKDHTAIHFVGGLSAEGKAMIVGVRESPTPFTWQIHFAQPRCSRNQSQGCPGARPDRAGPKQTSLPWRGSEDLHRIEHRREPLEAGDMQRRGESGQPTKGQRKIGPKARKAPMASVSAVDLEEQLDRRTRELDEALQQQTATSEVLSIIRRSPADPPTGV
jgi:hypothetical protein